jgi:hypothetical protein
VQPSAKRLVIPILIVVVGLGWLLTIEGIVPGVNWVWSLGLGIVGVLLLVRGINKFSVVVGPFFLIAALLSIVRQTGRMSIDAEVPVLVIILGLLMLVAQLPLIPAPQWVSEVPQSQDDSTKTAKH